MSNAQDIEAKLAQLTVRQCEILYWVCRNLEYAEIEDRIHFSVETITDEMARIYELFGLKSEKNKNKRRVRLFQEICPVLFPKIKDPSTDCALLGVIDLGAQPPVDRNALALVVRDNQEGIIPWRKQTSGAGFAGTQPQAARSGRSVIPITEPQETSGNGKSEKKRDWLLVLLGAALMLIAVLLVGFWAVRSGTIPLANGNDAGAVAKVTPIPTVVPLSSPAPTSITIFVPTVVTVVVTPTPVAVPFTPTPVPPTPTPVPINSPTPTFAQGDLTGRVADDVPGTRIGAGSKVTSILDLQTKPQDVYSLDLEAGHDVRLKITEEKTSFDVYVMLANPGTKSVASNTFSPAWATNAQDGWTGTIVPARSGTYYLVVRAEASQQRYTLTVTATNP